MSQDECTACEDVKQILTELGVDDSYFLSRGLVKFDDASASELVVVQVDADGREHELVSGAGEAWQAMKNAAKVDGVELEMVSAFRSKARQAQIVRGKFQRGLSFDDIFAVSAAPGFSEHHTGRAIDISTPGYKVLEEEFEMSDAFHWITVNSQMFGFSMTYKKGNVFGYLYEPWHWVWEKSKE